MKSKVGLYVFLGGLGLIVLLKEFFWFLIFLFKSSWSPQGQLNNKSIFNFFGKVTPANDTVENIEKELCVYRKYILQRKDGYFWESVWGDEVSYSFYIQSSEYKLKVFKLSSQNINKSSYLKMTIYDPCRMDLKKAKSFYNIYNGDPVHFNYYDNNFSSYMMNVRYRLIEECIIVDDPIYVSGIVKKIKSDGSELELSKFGFCVSEENEMLISRYSFPKFFFSPRFIVNLIFLGITLSLIALITYLNFYVS